MTSLLVFTNTLAGYVIIHSIKTTKDKCTGALLKPEEVKQRNIRLFEAIENNNYNATKEALEAGGQIDSIKISSEGLAKTPLYTAVFVGNPLVIELLFKAGAQIELKTEDFTAFSYLAYQKDISYFNIRLITELFIKSQPKQEHIDEAFHHAVMAKNIIVAEAILEYAQVSEEIESKLNYHPTLMKTVTDVAAAITPSGRKAMEEKHYYAWMSRQLAQKRAHHSTKEDEQNTLTD